MSTINTLKLISNLKRYPFIKNNPLQAWDSADELIIEHLSSLALSGKKILIINDQFGALSCTLKDSQITTYTDSFVSAQGIQENSRGALKAINHFHDFSGNYDYVLIKMPKNMSFFEDILCHITHHLHSNSKIICGVMIKHLPKISFDLLQKYIGETTTSLAHKKARLIFTNFQKEKVESPFPIQIHIEPMKSDFINHSNLFSREKLDIGTRFFLDHIPTGDFKKILDLGCGNGLIGIKAKYLNPEATIIFSDDSFMAIQSSTTNYQKHFHDQADFYWLNCFEKQPENSLDLVLCNPPFHQQNTVGDFIANQMFIDAHRALKNGRKIRVIGNSHLGYQLTLKKIFGNSQIITNNEKFMIIDARKN